MQRAGALAIFERDVLGAAAAGFGTTREELGIFPRVRGVPA